MPTIKGFIRTIEVRDNGWVECTVRSPHAGNTDTSVLLQSVDGDVEQRNRRLAQLGLLRDALARTLPVELDYRNDEEMGRLIEDVVVNRRVSFDGWAGTRTIQGTVINVSVTERGVTSSASPYSDQSDLAGVTVLTDGGAVESVALDLQRPEPQTAHAILDMVDTAHKSRRPIVLVLSDSPRDNGGKDRVRGASSNQGAIAHAIACHWVEVPEDDLLDFHTAFVERMAQRSESYESSDVTVLSHIEVLFTTAPDQTPVGNVSQNGSFKPTTQSALVHVDSPLVERLQQALVKGLQVRLGVQEKRWIHAVELVSPLGSAARPIWIDIRQRAECPDDAESLCSNTPTIRHTTEKALDHTPQTVHWSGHGFFNEGVWRFSIAAADEVELTVDGESPCCVVTQDDVGISTSQQAMAELKGAQRAKVDDIDRNLASKLVHVYLNGLHRVDLRVRDRACGSPFRMLTYRLR